MYKGNIINFVNRNEIIDNLDEMNKLKKAGIYFITDPKSIVDSVSNNNTTKTFHELKDNNLGRVLPKLNSMESYLFSYPFTANSTQTQNLLYSVLYYDTNKRPHSGYNVADVDDQISVSVLEKSNDFFGFNNSLVQDELSTGLVNNGYHKMNNDILEKIRNKDTSSIVGYEFSEKNNGFPSLLFGENFSSSFRLGEDLKYQGFLDYKTGSFAQKYLHQIMADYVDRELIYDFDHSMFYLNDGKWIPTKISFHNFSRSMYMHYGYEKIPRYMNFPSYNYYPLMYNESSMTSVSDGRYKIDNEIFLSNPNVNFDTYKYFNNDMNYIPYELADQTVEDNPNEPKKVNNATTFGNDGKVKLRFTNEDKLGEDLFSKLGILEVIVTDNVIIQKYTNREYNLIRYFYENKWTNWKSNLPMVTSKDDVNYPIGFGSHRNNYHTHAMKGKLYSDDDILNLADKVPRIKELNKVREESSKYWLDKVKKEKINDVFIKRGDDEGIDLIEFENNKILFLNRNRDKKDIEDIAIEFKSLKESEFNSSGSYDNRFKGFMIYLPFYNSLTERDFYDVLYNSTFTKPMGNVYGLDYRYISNYINDKRFTLEAEKNLSFIRYGSNYLNINNFNGNNKVINRGESLSESGYINGYNPYMNPNYITGTDKKQEAKKRGHDVFINGKNTNEYKRKYNNDLANFPEREWLLNIRPSYVAPSRRGSQVLNVGIETNAITIDLYRSDTKNVVGFSGFCLIRLGNYNSETIDVYVDLSYANFQDIRLYGTTNQGESDIEIKITKYPHEPNSIPFTLRVYCLFTENPNGEGISLYTTREPNHKYPIIGFYIQDGNGLIKDYIDNMKAIHFKDASFYGNNDNVGRGFSGVNYDNSYSRPELRRINKREIVDQAKQLINTLEEV